jgi:hypothetical protein
MNCLFGKELEMRIQDIQIGKYYRLKNTNGEFTQYYGWVKVLDIFKRGQWNSPDKTKSIVKCEHTVNKTDTFGFIRYFRPMDLVDTNEN